MTVGGVKLEGEEDGRLRGGTETDKRFILRGGIERLVGRRGVAEGGGEVEGKEAEEVSAERSEVDREWTERRWRRGERKEEAVRGACMERLDAAVECARARKDSEVECARVREGSEELGRGGEIRGGEGVYVRRGEGASEELRARVDSEELGRAGGLRGGEGEYGLTRCECALTERTRRGLLRGGKNSWWRNSA